LVKESTEFALMGTNIRAVYSLQEDLWSAEVDEGQINQVINNIVINATQAMRGGREIYIQGENVMVDAHSALPLPEGKYIKISIQDKGVGIPEEQLEKIFDPYYSTKQTGSGLGLAISFSIIKKHGGHLAADSKIGTGATFHFYLSASEKRMSEKGDKVNRIVSGRGRVLVMDDEDIIRLIIGEMLDEIGYEAEFAADGEAALALYVEALKSGRPFDAVLMDLTIRGGMGGDECIGKLLTIDPAVKAVVSSGYSDGPILSNYKKIGFKGIIAKPYQVEDLSEILFSVIHEGEDG